MADEPAPKRLKTDCAECGLPRIKDNGHQKLFPGWCPIVQRFSTRSTRPDERPSSGKLLYERLNQHPVTIAGTGARQDEAYVPYDKDGVGHASDAAAQQFVRNILAGKADLVKQQLAPCRKSTKCNRSSCCRPELVLMRVDHGSHDWSVLHLAVDCIGRARASEDHEAERAAEDVLAALHELD